MKIERIREPTGDEFDALMSEYETVCMQRNKMNDALNAITRIVNAGNQGRPWGVVVFDELGMHGYGPDLSKFGPLGLGSCQSTVVT